MTGANVVFPSMAVPSPPRAVPRYSIDSFAEFSAFALSRTPTTATLAAAADNALLERRSVQEHDEELFRDLFAADNDWDAPSGSFKNATPESRKAGGRAAPSMRSSSRIDAHPPYPAPPMLPKSLGDPIPTEMSKPTLSVAAPPLNLAGLVNSRPAANEDAAVEDSCGWSGRLGQVTETEDEDDEERPESNPAPARCSPSRKTKLTKPKDEARSNGNSSSTKLQHETLSFLEKLDLKALLHTPRPDVLDFYPASTLGGPGVGATIATGSVSATNQEFSGTSDFRVEHERVSANSTFKLKKPSSTFKQHNQTSGSSKKETSEISSRLAHMETTYGTTKNETRRTRKGTIERLANPILGYTSTLQALSPEQRRKREMAIGEEDWNPCTSSPATSKLRRKETMTSGLEHLTSSARVYEAAAASASTMALRTHENSFAGLGNNQLDDQRDSQVSIKNPILLVKKKPANTKLVSARKAVLKKKFENRQQQQYPAQPFERSGPDRISASEQSVGSTFLTQHEDEEAMISSRTKRSQSTRTTTVLSTLARQQLSELETRKPRPPASVRSAKPTQSTRTQNLIASESSENTAHQMLTRSSGKPLPPRQQQQQQHQAPSSAPRKPRNGDRGQTSARRLFSRVTQSPAALAERAKSNVATKPSKGESTTASVPKRKASGSKSPSASAMLLMGPDAISQPFTASTPTPSKRGSSFNNVRQPHKSQSTRTTRTPRVPVHTNSRGNSATKDTVTSERRSRQSPKYAGGSDRTFKSSVTLPAIPPTARQGSEFGARRKNLRARDAVV